MRMLRQDGVTIPLNEARFRRLRLDCGFQTAWVVITPMQAILIDAAGAPQDVRIAFEEMNLMPCACNFDSRRSAEYAASHNGNAQASHASEPRKPSLIDSMMRATSNAIDPVRKLGVSSSNELMNAAASR